MLKNPELFKNVETGLRSMGTIKAFEDEHGKILGRAMITLTDIPESIEVGDRRGHKEKDPGEQRVGTVSGAQCTETVR